MIRERMAQIGISDSENGVLSSLYNRAFNMFLTRCELGWAPIHISRDATMTLSFQ